MRFAALFFLLLGVSPLWATVVVPSDEEFLSSLSPTLSGKTDFFDRRVKRISHTNSIEVTCEAAFPGELALTKKIVPEYDQWREWLLTDINLPEPGASDYIFQFHDIVKRDPTTITTVFSFNIPFFHKHRQRSFDVFRFESEKSVWLTAETQLSTGSAVKKAHAYLKILSPSTTQKLLWVSVKATIEFRNAFLYLALPDKVLLREVGERLRMVAENYRREEVFFRTGKPRTTHAPPVALPSLE
jgi:hypothetical protein